MFTGAQPVLVPTGLDAGWHVLPQDASRASELLASMTSAQQGVVILGRASAARAADVLAALHLPLRQRTDNNRSYDGRTSRSAGTSNW